ncbi:hypothetical protein BgiMline_013406, partial [Biomphalaria glabrata]
ILPSIKGTLFLVTSIVSHLAALPTNVINKCPQPSELNPVPPFFIYGHPEDCQQFFLCVFGTPYLMSCPATTSFSELLGVCVDRYSPKDICAQENAVRECSRGASLLAHPQLCHRFYNCSLVVETSSILGRYQDECPYPQYFDTLEKVCKPYSEVSCLDRLEVKDKCEYSKAYECTDVEHCEDCQAVFPSCQGLTDGIYPNPEKLWTTFYLTCTDERVATFTCPPFLDKPGIFSPRDKKCVSLYEVSSSDNFLGRKPTCVSKLPGTYPVLQDPRVYYSCPGPQVAYCPEGSVFSQQTQTCNAP